MLYNKMPRLHNSKNKSTYKYLVEIANDDGKPLRKYYISQWEITESLGISRTAIYYLLAGMREEAGVSNQKFVITKLDKPLPVFRITIERIKYF